jgi:hypothetical protein
MTDVIKFKIECKCGDLCQHALEKISEVIQEAFDYGYDEGWEDSLTGLRDMMISNGVAGAADLSIPPPPPRKEKKSMIIKDYRNPKKDYNN